MLAGKCEHFAIFGNIIPAHLHDALRAGPPSTFNKRSFHHASCIPCCLCGADVLQESFFRKLPSALPAIPPAVANRKILPLLAGALEFGGAPPVAVSSLLLIGE